MAVGVNGCACGAAGAALLALLLLPAPLLLPDLAPTALEPPPDPADPAAPAAPGWVEAAAAHCSPLDLLLTVAVLLVALATYMAEWIQRKLMEQRILKLNSSLALSSARLGAWAAQRRQAAGVLRLARDCTAEYDLLLLLLLQRHAPPPAKLEPAAAAGM